MAFSAASCNGRIIAGALDQVVSSFACPSRRELAMQVVLALAKLFGAWGFE